MNEITAHVLNIINEILISENKETIDCYNDKLKLREDLEFDSLMLAVLTVKIEDAFKIDIFENGIVHTVGDVVNKVKG
jgi:acyl carrier protein